MDSFLRRLKYYGIGFSIGLLFVVFFFQNRGCSWFPSNRVKNSILERVLVVPDEEMAKLRSQGISKDDLIQVLNDGDVDFQQSAKQGNPQVYKLLKEFNGKEMSFYFTLPQESFISEIHFSESSARKVKNTKEGYGTIIRFPADKDLVIVDEGKKLTCLQETMRLINPKTILKCFVKSGKIDFSKSDLRAKPKAIQTIVFKDPSGRIAEATAIWYKNKINITSFYVSFENDCERYSTENVDK
ncbi:MAG: hypothetical protein ACK49D_06395 [Flavobacteriia bacterium]|jgi:hypothetical protein|nr:hypothetical protein [Cryomorphaceae bacterium]